MGSKVQGEGDYESARHYNDETRKFVDEKTKGGKELKGDAAEASDELTPPEEEALCEEHNFPVLRKPFLASDVMNQIRSRLLPAAGVVRA